MVWNSVVGAVTSLQAGHRKSLTSIPCRDQILFLLPNLQTCLEAYTASYSMGTAS